MRLPGPVLPLLLVLLLLGSGCTVEKPDEKQGPVEIRYSLTSIQLQHNSTSGQWRVDCVLSMNLTNRNPRVPADISFVHLTSYTEHSIYFPFSAMVKVSKSIPPLESTIATENLSFELNDEEFATFMNEGYETFIYVPGYTETIESHLKRYMASHPKTGGSTPLPTVPGNHFSG